MPISDNHSSHPTHPSISPTNSAVSAVSVTSNNSAIAPLPPPSPARVLPQAVHPSSSTTVLPTPVMAAAPSAHMGGPTILTSMPVFPAGMVPIMNGVFPYNMTTTPLSSGAPAISYTYQPTGQVIMNSAVGMPSGVGLAVGKDPRMNIMNTPATPTTPATPVTSMTPATPAMSAVIGNGVNYITPTYNSPFAKMQHDLPASFHPLPILETDPKVNMIYNSVMTANESVRSNFFLPYSILWLMSSSRVREMIVHAMESVKKRQEQHEGENASKASLPSSPLSASPKTPLRSPEQPSSEVDKKLPSLSPSIQPLCAIHNLTPLGDDHRNEVEVLGDLIELIDNAVTCPTLEYISNLLLTISTTFISSGLSSKYQQFGISFYNEIVM